MIAEPPPSLGIYSPLSSLQHMIRRARPNGVMPLTSVSTSTPVLPANGINPVLASSRVPFSIHTHNSTATSTYRNPGLPHLLHLKSVYQQQEELDIAREPRLQRKRREERKIKVGLLLQHFLMCGIDFIKLYQRRRAVAQTLLKQHHLSILDVVIKLYKL